MRTGSAIFAVALCVTVTAIMLTGCNSSDDASYDVSGESSTTSSAVQTTISVGGKPGQQAPAFSLPRLAGGDLTLASLRGKAVLVDFWDTWCGPCRIALPHLQELSETYAENLVVVGVAMGRDGEAAVKKFVTGSGLTFEMVLFNQDMQLLRKFGGINGLPTTFLIDADGIVRNRWIGAKPKAEYERALQQIVGS